MLLIACSAIITASAESADNAQQKGKQDNVPYNVKSLFWTISQTWGSPNEVYSVNKNPETNQIESSVRITTFSADNDKFPHMAGKTYLNTSVISKSFKDDEPKSYQILHLSPGDNKRFSLKAVNENGESETYNIRNNSEEEMWLMCCKNPQNPKLRDVYAIKWVITKEDTKVNGVIYQITSLRPDMYEKPYDSSKKIFKIVGRVDNEIKDSLYNIYIADTGADLANIGDDDYVACVPVINKRFEWQTELDKPCAGRIRCIFPDGSLCSAWINLDFVPGETYNITVHNGWYDEDRDYERRVGRYSGKSLLNDLQKRGIDDQTVEVADTIPADYQKAHAVQLQDWRKTITPQQQAQLMMKGELVEMEVEKIKATFEHAAQGMKVGFERYGRMPGFDGTINIDYDYERIYQQNKELDKKYQEVIKLAKKLNVPIEEMPNLYKEILKSYAEQNKGLTKLSTNGATQTKQAKKTQKFVNDLMEKYIKEMEKCLE